MVKLVTDRTTGEQFACKARSLRGVAACAVLCCAAQGQVLTTPGWRHEWCWAFVLGNVLDTARWRACTQLPPGVSERLMPVDSHALRWEQLHNQYWLESYKTTQPAHAGDEPAACGGACGGQ